MSKAIIKLIEMWPSNRDFAEDIGLKNISHGRTMKVRGRIPRAYWYPLVAAAKKRKLSGVTIKYLEEIHQDIGMRRS